MATRTKRGTSQKPRNSPNKLKAIGQPIERGKVYTVSQFRACLAISRPTLHRYVHELGMQKFTTPLQGKAWQITGDDYHDWLKWRRENANAEKSKKPKASHRPSTAP